MSKLRTRLALDSDYINQPLEIKIDMIVLPYIESVGKIKADEINFPFSGAVTDEIYKILINNYSFSESSTLKEIQDAVNDAADQWQNQESQGKQNVAKRRG
jgi:hypothetical protein